MTVFASRDIQPLSKIAIIDQAAIDQMTSGLDIPGAVSDYLIAHPPSGGLTIDQIKADTSIADAITKKHSNTSDHAIQDLSGLQPKELGKGLSANDLTSTLKTSYDGAVTHAGSAHAPAAATVGADWNTNVLNKPSIPAAQVQSDWNAGSGMGQILNKPTIAAARLFANLAATVVTSGTTEKVLLQLAIPANSAIVGSTYRAWIIGNSSSTGTLIFKVRCGNLGTIADTIDWTAVTSAAQVANARAGFDVLITIRSATTIKAEGVGYAGAIQLPTVIAVPTTPAIVISNPWYINLTVICSVGTFTAQVGSIEEIR